MEFVTTADYTKKTEERAYELGLTLIGTDEIYDIIKETNSWDLLTEDSLTKGPNPTEPRSVDTLIGIALGAGNIAHQDDHLEPLDPNVTPREAFIEAIRALYRHGFISVDSLRDRGDSPFIFVPNSDYDQERPDNLEEGVLIPIIEDRDGFWCVRVPSDSPEDLFHTLLKIIHNIAHNSGIPIEEFNPNAANWY